MSLRSSELYRDRHLIDLGWLPPREAEVLRGDLEVAKRELDKRFQWQVHLCNDKTWRPYSALLCSNCRASGTESKSISVGELLAELERLRKDLESAKEESKELNAKLDHVLTSTEEGTLPYWQKKHDDMMRRHFNDSVKYTEQIQALTQEAQKLRGALVECVSALEYAWKHNHEEDCADTPVIRGPQPDICHLCKTVTSAIATATPLLECDK